MKDWAVQKIKNRFPLRRVAVWFFVALSLCGWLWIVYELVKVR